MLGTELKFYYRNDVDFIPTYYATVKKRDEAGCYDKKRVGKGNDSFRKVFFFFLFRL